MNNARAFIANARDPCSPLSVDASRTALLLLDFHRFIVASQSGGGENVLGATDSLRSWARSRGILVVHCLIDLKAVTAPSRKMARRANEVREKMNSGALEFGGEHGRIAAVADEYVFWRPPGHVSALGSYGLKAFLSQHDIRSLLLAGFSTSGCLINTAKASADEGFIVTVVKDCCGDKSLEAHEIIMSKLLVGQAHVVDADTLVKTWDEVGCLP